MQGADVELKAFLRQAHTACPVAGAHFPTKLGLLLEGDLWSHWGEFWKVCGMAPAETGDKLVFFVNGKKVRKIPAFCLACSWAVPDYFLFLVGFSTSEVF